MIRHLDKQSPVEPRGYVTEQSPAYEQARGETVGKFPRSEAEKLLSQPVMIPRNPIALQVRTISLVFIMDFGIALIVLSFGALPALTSQALFLLTGILILVKTIILIAIMLKTSKDWVMLGYSLSERQLFLDYGLVNHDQVAYELDNIRHVKLHQGPLGRLFDYGLVELKIATAGLDEVVKLHDLKNPAHFQDVFRNYIG